MNKKQLIYNLGGKIYTNFQDLTWAGASIMGGSKLVEEITKKEPSFLRVGVSAAVLLFAGKKTKDYFMDRLQAKVIGSRVGNTPMEGIDRIFIEDEEGLNRVLDRTAKNEWKEWANFLRLRYDLENSKGIVEEFIETDSMEAKSYSKFESAGLYQMLFSVDREEILRQGVWGHHHYHIESGAHNYVISNGDRSGLPLPGLGFGLISFNVSKKPEIIGYNQSKVFIPTDSSKRELVAASPEDILEYLAA